MSPRFSPLRAQITLAAARNAIEPDAMNAMFAVLNGAPLLRPVQTEAERQLGQSTFTQTLDSNGNVLVAGKNYLYRGKKIKVLREEFGSGNIADTYQRVHYINHNLCEHFLIVDGKYPRGIFNGAVYHSDLIPVEETAEE